MMPRLVALARTTLLVLAFVAHAAAAAPRAPLSIRQVAPDFAVVRVAKDVYVFVSGNTTHDIEDGNTTVIVTSEGVVVVDAPATDLSRRHLAEIRKLTRQPVRYLVNTHWHADHVFGNHVYKEAFPDVRIVANRYTATISDRRNPGILERFYKGDAGSKLMNQFKTSAEQGVDADGKPLKTDYDRERARRSYREALVALAVEQKDGVYVGPNVVFEVEKTIRLGGKEIKLMTAAGHTRADTIVFLPADRLLVTGDLVIAPVPYGINSLFDEWIVTLDRLMAMPVDVYVPGHGNVQFDREYLTLERDLISALMTQAERAVHDGLTIDEFKKTLDLAAFEAKFVHGDPELKWGWDNYFMDRAPERALAIAKGDF